MKKRTVLLLALCLALTLCAAPAPATEDAFVLDFEAEDLLTGEIIDVDYFSPAYITIVNFWATWCGPCIRELPDLAEVAAETEGNILVLGVLTDGVDSQGNIDYQAIENAQALAADAGVSYPVVLPEGNLANLAAAIEAYPTTFIVDDEGIVYSYVEGARSLDDWVAIGAEWMNEIYEFE